MTAFPHPRSFNPSRLDPQPEPTPRHPQPRIQDARHARRDPAKRPQAVPIQRIPRPQNGTAAGPTDQHPERNGPEAHAHPCPDPRLVLGQRDEADGRHRDEDAGEEADEERDGDDGGLGLHGHHAEDEDAGDEGAGRDEVEGTGEVGEGVG